MTAALGTPAIRFRVMPASIVSHPAWPSLDPITRLLGYDLHVGSLCQSTIGIYRLTPDELVALLRMDSDAIERSLAALESMAFIEYDREAGVMRLPAWLLDYRPTSARSFRSGLNWLLRVPACPTRSTHIEQLRLFACGWGDKFAAALNDVDAILARADEPHQAQLSMPFPLALAR